MTWRDIKNPEAGGAELFALEVIKRLLQRGYDVTLFTARFSGASKEDFIDGIKIVRRGGKYTVYEKARAYYLLHKSDFDIVIDEMNTKPFLTPKFVKGELQILGLIHGVPGKSLFYELPFPINYIAYHYLVKRWFGIYKTIPCITVSNSQAENLRRIGLQKLFIVPEGLSVVPLREMPQKESKPTIAFLGRLKAYKRPDHALRAFSLIKKEIPDAKMLVIGDGEMRKKLERQWQSNDIVFWGKVADTVKYELLSKAHLVLVPSVEEGWGLVVTESNAMGTPTIAYNVPGLKDSVKDGQTGILVEGETPEDLAKAAILLLRDRDRLFKLSNEALEYSKRFSWDNTAEAFDNIIRNLVHDVRT